MTQALSDALHPYVLPAGPLAGPATTVNLLVDIDVPEANQAAWTVLVEEMARETLSEDGCLYYAFTRVRDASTRFQVPCPLDGRSLHGAPAVTPGGLVGLAR